MAAELKKRAILPCYAKMKHMKKALILLLVASIAELKIKAQDLHFSQYFNTPLLVNPANTGFSPDADYRLGLNYRNQWASISNPFKTMSLWGDVQLFNDRFENGWMGIGGSVFSDKAGTGSLTSTRINATVAYHQMLGFGSLLSMGANIGYVQKRIDLSKLTFDDQWNTKFFDINIPTGETFAANSVSYISLQAGINYAIYPNENIYINIGASMSNINRPKESFFAAGSTDTRIDNRYTFFLNGLFKLNDQWILNPNAYYSSMAGATEMVLGVNANYNLSGDGSKQLIGGMYYRNADAVIPMVGYQLNNWKLTVNYDVTMSGLKTFNQSRGAYELSIVKTGVFDKSRPIKCNVPSF
jgi:type IX secretion system PorP/SprF family membrane protein